MENGVTVSITPLQILLSLAFQAWIVIFPIIIIRKLNSISELLQSQYEDESEES
ncbi:MAG: hypothetical protein PHY73_03520 [Candidatus Omnitrophica bacterium]|nr:hypothetical protein [Candidatus Omnitrophota bacterium]